MLLQIINLKFQNEKKKRNERKKIRNKGRKEWREGWRERGRKEGNELSVLEDSFLTLADPLELCYYLYLKLFFGFLKVLLGHGIIFLPHFIHDGTEVQAWSSIHLYVYIIAQMST